MQDFRSLSPLDFENLVRDLLQAELDLRMESFAPGKDGGVDFRYATAGATTIIQVKHYLDSPFSALRRVLAKENQNVLRLKPQRYILVTSAALTPASKDRLIAAIPAAPLARDDVLGREDLNNILGRHPEIERQHFKLWLASTAVLERILHSGVYNRTDAELGLIKAFVPKFVQNPSVARAEGILERNGALIVAGEPGVGKTALARILVWLHAAQDWRIFVVDDFEEAMEVSAAGEKRLIFFDDFLGQIRLTDDLVRKVDQRFPIFLDRLKGNKDLRFILTTREYLLNQAQIQSRRLDSARVASSELVLNVGVYTRAIRTQIVFNHVYFSDLAQEERQELLADHFYMKMIDHRNFSPRLIELLTSAEYHAVGERSVRETVARVLDNPSELWEQPYRSHFSAEARVLMRALFFSGYYVILDNLLGAFKRFAVGSGLSIPEGETVLRFRHAVKELEGSVIAIRDRRISFSNPGVKDFLSRVILEDRLIETIAVSVGTFGELDDAWSFYCSHRSECDSYLQDLEIWAAALGRIISTNSGSPIERVRLSLEMCYSIESEELVQLAVGALQTLKQEGVDCDQVTESRWALERLSMLPPGSAVDVLAREIVPSTIAEMLTESGDSLPLDEIKTLTSSLEDFSRDSELAKDSAKSALQGFLKKLDDSLSDVSSTSELDTFEGELQESLRKYGVEYGYSARRDVELRRETLQEREASRDEEPYKPAQAPSAVEISDEEIKSLFAMMRLPSG